MFIKPPSEDQLVPFTTTLLAEQKKAVDARVNAGLDKIWANARDQYQGLDAVNRGRSGGIKARTLDGPVSTTMAEPANEKRSTVFVNITRPYTNAGTARVADILLPAGDKNNWELEATPVSETALLQTAVAAYPALLNAMPPALKARVVQTPEEREASLDAAKLLIEDWLTECKWNSETRNQISEAGKVGTGVLKGPFPKISVLSEDVQEMLNKLPLFMEADEAAMLTETLKFKLLYQPVGEVIPVENCFPDMPNCGNDVQKGRFFWERVPDVSKIQLQDMMEDSSYFADQIAFCIDEDPKPWCDQDKGTKPKSYTIGVRTGEIDLNKLMDAADNEEGEVIDKPSPNLVFVQIEMCNERIIKINQLPLDIRRFPYYMLLWESRPDSWAGIGIPEQIETPQRGLNAAVRAGNDNLRWAVGFQLLIDQGLIEPFDAGDDWEPQAYKKWRVLTDSLSGMMDKTFDPRKAFDTIEFPNQLQQILPWIDFWLQMAESTTGLPLMFQGQKSSDSVGVSQALLNNATTNLRMFIKHWDDDVCAEFIQALYAWVQKYGPEEAKGDAVAKPLGSSTLITRELQQQALTQLLDRTVQPIFKKSPAKTIDMLLEGFQIDPAQLALDDEEKQMLESAANKPDPAVEVATIKAQVDQLIEQSKDDRERWIALLEAQQAGASMEQAAEAVETQTAGNIAQEGLRQQGAVEKEAVKANMNVAAPGQPKAPELPDTNPTTEESVELLGL